MALTENDIQQIVKALEPKFDDVEERFAGIDDRLDGVEKRFDFINERLDAFEKRFDGLDGRLDQLEKDVVKAIVDDVMTNIDVHEERINRLETVVVGS